MGIKHNYQSATANDPTDEVSSTRWNADHDVTTSTVTAAKDDKVVIKDTSATDVLSHVTIQDILNFIEFQSVSYSSAINLSSNKVMTQTSVTGAITFTNTGTPKAGCQVILRLVANGTNVPAFTGMTEITGSSGYDNRNNVVNEINFFYDGTETLYSIFQRIGDTGIVDTTPPTLSSAVVSNSTPTVVRLTFSEPLTTSTTLRTTDFAVSGHTISSIAFFGTTAIDLTVDAFVSGEAARTVSYTQPGTSINQVKDVAGNLLATITSSAITNNVGPSVNYINFANSSGGAASKTANGSGFNYSMPGPQGYFNTSNFKLPASTDGYFSVKLASITGTTFPLFSLATSNTNFTYNQTGNKKTIYVESGNYKVVDGATPNITPNVTTRAYVAGDILKINRVGAAWTAQISSDNGVTFTTIHNYANDTAEMYPLLTAEVNSGGTVSFVLPNGSPSTVAA